MHYKNIPKKMKKIIKLITNTIQIILLMENFLTFSIIIFFIIMKREGENYFFYNEFGGAFYDQKSPP